jgi:hypothetical protein
MTDLFSQKDDLAADWEHMGSDKFPGAMSMSSSTLKGKITSSPATDTSFRQAVDDAFGSIVSDKSGKPGDFSPYVTETTISKVL